jgi:hypothetical protein
MKRTAGRAAMTCDCSSNAVLAGPEGGRPRSNGAAVEFPLVGGFAHTKQRSRGSVKQTKNLNRAPPHLGLKLSSATDEQVDQIQSPLRQARVVAKKAHMRGCAHQRPLRWVYVVWVEAVARWSWYQATPRPADGVASTTTARQKHPPRTNKFCNKGGKQLALGARRQWALTKPTNPPR